MDEAAVCRFKNFMHKPMFYYNILFDFIALFGLCFLFGEFIYMRV